MKAKPGPRFDPRLRITWGRRFAFGPGKAELLANIRATGSIAEAAKQMGMSYMRAWTLVKSMNRGFVKPLVVTVRGGRQRGGAKLTAIGARVLLLYREIERRSRQAARASEQKLARLLAQ
jgi:molybdate transport system regulatory protein